MTRFIAMIGFTLLAVSCAPKKKFVGNAPIGAAEEKAAPVPAPVPAPSPAPAKSLVVRCEDPSAKLQTLTQDISFAETTDKCPWDASPNVSRQDQTVTASVTQSIDLKLPKGTICTIDISSPAESKIRYDDFIVLTVDSHILFASNRTLMLFMTKMDPNAGATYDWDFTKVVGKSLKDWNAGTYCVGKNPDEEIGASKSGGDCIIPATEQVGPVKINLAPETIGQISKAIQGKTSVPVNLTVIGDNDIEKDCRHTQFDITTTIKYLPN